MHKASGTGTDSQSMRDSTNHSNQIQYPQGKQHSLTSNSPKSSTVNREDGRLREEKWVSSMNLSSADCNHQAQQLLVKQQSSSTPN